MNPPPAPIELAREADFALGGAQVRPALRLFAANGAEETIEPRVMQVLVALARHTGEVVGRDELVTLCWEGRVIGEDAIQRAIAKVRKLGDASGAFLVETIPKVGYRLRALDAAPIGGLPEPEQEPSERQVRVAGTAQDGIPFLALLPLTYRDSNEAMEILARDLTEEITRELARNRFFKVISARTMAVWHGSAMDYRALGRELNARYLIEGKLERDSANFRLTAQVIDADTAGLVWSKRFVSKPDEAATSPENFPGSIASQISEHIRQIEMSRAMTKQGPLSVWEYLLRAMAPQMRIESNSMRNAIDDGRKAASLAPDLGLAHAALAGLLGAAVSLLGDELDDVRRREIRDHIKRAMLLDGDNPQVLSSLVNAYAVLGDWEAGLRLARRVVEFDPKSAQALYALGRAHHMAGQTAEAIAAFKESLRAAPHDMSRLVVLHLLGVCLCLEGRPAEAEVAVSEALTLHPDFGGALIGKTMVEMQRGQVQAARATLMRLREAEPGLSIDQHLRFVTAYPLVRERAQALVSRLRELWDETAGEAKSP